MANLGARLLEMSFGRPSGPLGRIGGRLMARGNAVTERQLVDVAELGRHEVVLVLGPGPGIGLEAAARRVHRVLGVDPSEVMLESCRRQCAEPVRRGTVRLVNGVAADTGQPSGSVDVAGFDEVRTWTWEPPGRGAFTASQLRARRPTAARAREL